MSKITDLMNEMERAQKDADHCLYELELHPSTGSYLLASKAVDRHREAIRRFENELAMRKAKRSILICLAFILGVITYQYLKR